MLAIILGSILVTGAPASATLPAITPAEFECWFRAAEAKRLEIPIAVELRAREFQFVFVGGYRNETIRGYFAQNIAELVARGVPRRQIHVIHPSSRKGDEENAEHIAARFAEIARPVAGRLVVIAHSRGACDALRFALANPEFVTNRVEALFLVQGPFGGSGAAAYASGAGIPIDKAMPWRHRIIAQIAGKVVRWFTSKEERDVLGGLAPEEARARWLALLERHREALATVGPRTYYVRSEIHSKRLHFARRAIAVYLETYHGPSDGLVALRDQSLPGLGTVVATVRAGHADLTQRYPASRASRQLRRALVDAILMGVGREAPGG